MHLSGTREKTAVVLQRFVAVHLVEIHERVPEGVLGQDTRVPDDDAPESSTRESHVEAARVRKKTDALVLV